MLSISDCTAIKLEFIYLANSRIVFFKQITFLCDFPKLFDQMRFEVIKGQQIVQNCTIAYIRNLPAYMCMLLYGSYYNGNQYLWYLQHMWHNQP